VCAFEMGDGEHRAKLRKCASPVSVCAEDSGLDLQATRAREIEHHRDLFLLRVTPVPLQSSPATNQTSGASATGSKKEKKKEEKAEGKHSGTLKLFAMAPGIRVDRQQKGRCWIQDCRRDARPLWWASYANPHAPTCATAVACGMLSCAVAGHRRNVGETWVTGHFELFGHLRRFFPQFLSYCDTCLEAGDSHRWSTPASACQLLLSIYCTAR